MVHHKIKIVFLLGLTLGWCACIRFHPHELSPRQTLNDFDGRSLNCRELREFFKANGQTPDWPLTSWNLHALTLAGFFFHPDLDVARAQWAVAQAGRLTAGERPNPNLSLPTEYNSTLRSGAKAWNPAINFDITIETAGKRGYRIAQARQLSGSAYLNIHSVAWQVRSRLRQAFLELYAAEHRQTLLSQNQHLLSETIGIMENQLAAGAISAYELAQARMNFETSRLEWLDAQNTRAQARISLASALGVPLSALEGVTFDFAEFEGANVNMPERLARERALLNRSDLLAALADYAASQAALQLEVAKQYPDIHLGPGYIRDTLENKWTLGLSFLLPIFNQNHGPIAEAEARREEMASRFLALQTTVLNAIEQAVAGLGQANDKRQVAAEIENNLQTQARRAQSMFKLGEISKSDLLAIELEHNTAEIALLNARINTQKALGALEDAMQDSPALTRWMNDVTKEIKENKKRK
ncbi:MAG: TolC family protein [Candidatus Omnitrophota bacterium]